MTVKPLVLKDAEERAVELGLNVCLNGIHANGGTFCFTSECPNKTPSREWKLLMELRESSKSDGLGIFLKSSKWPRGVKRVQSWHIRNLAMKTWPTTVSHYISTAAMILYLVSTGVEVRLIPNSNDVYVKADMVDPNWFHYD